MKSQNEKNLETLIAAYQNAEAELKALQESRQNLKAPERPLRVNSLSELSHYSQLRKQFEDKQKPLQKRVDDIRLSLSGLKRDIIDLIPEKNIWIRVNSWAVSTYWDVWGGGHYEIEIRRWSDSLPKQADRTYYP